MGVEALAVQLKPHFGDVHCDVVYGSLVYLRFDPAAATLPGDAQCLLVDASHVIEATARCRGGALAGLDLRIAVCHSPSALTKFFGVIQFLAQEHGLAVVDDRHSEYEPGRLAEWEESASVRFLELRGGWMRLFDGDGEETALTPGDAWRHFLTKHPATTRTAGP